MLHGRGQFFWRVLEEINEIFHCIPDRILSNWGIRFANIPTTKSFQPDAINFTRRATSAIFALTTVLTRSSSSSLQSYAGETDASRSSSNLRHQQPSPPSHPAHTQESSAATCRSTFSSLVPPSQSSGTSFRSRRRRRPSRSAHSSSEIAYGRLGIAKARSCRGGQDSR